MSSDDFPITEEGNNWTVAVFRCPRKNWTEILSAFFSELDKQKVSLIPHYKIEWFEKTTDTLFVSVRILRNKNHERLVKSQAEELLKDYPHEIDPEESFFRKYNSWIKHGDKDTKWTTERCQILSKISRFALEIIKSDTSREDKEEWTHMFSNMAGMFDSLKIYRSPETILKPDKTPYKILDYGDLKIRLVFHDGISLLQWSNIDTL